MPMRKPAMAGVFSNMFAPPSVKKQKTKAAPEEETRTFYELAGELVTNFLTDEPQSQHKQKKLWQKFEDLLSKMDRHERSAALEYSHLAIQESVHHRYELFAERIASQFCLSPRAQHPQINMRKEPYHSGLALQKFPVLNNR